MSATDSEAHGCKPCGVVPVRWRRCRAKTGPAFAHDAASIPAPSFRRRAAKRRAPSPTWLGSPMRVHCTAAWPSALWPPSFLRTAAALPPWRGGSRGPVRFVRLGGPRLRLVACVSSPPALRPFGPLRLPFPRRGSALSSVARARGFGLQRVRGLRPFLALCAVFPLCSLWFLPPPLFRLASPCGGLRRRSGFYRGDVAFHASLGSAFRPGGGGSLPLNLLVPRPYSFAIDRGSRLRYNGLGGGRNDPTGTLFHPVSCCRIPGSSG